MNNINIDADFCAAGAFLLGGGAAKVTAAGPETRLDFYLEACHAAKLAAASRSIVKALGGATGEEPGPVYPTMVEEDWERKPVTMEVNPSARAEMGWHVLSTREAYVSIHDGDSHIAVHVNATQAAMLLDAFTLAAAALHAEESVAAPPAENS